MCFTGEYINIIFKFVTVMYADNSAAIELASNPIYYFTKTLRPSIFELVQFERKMNLASLLKYESRLQNNLAFLNSKPVTVCLYETLKRSSIVCEDFLPISTKHIRMRGNILKEFCFKEAC